MHSYGCFRDLSCKFADVREIFGIPKRGTSLYHRALSETLSLFLDFQITGVSEDSVA